MKKLTHQFRIFRDSELPNRLVFDVTPEKPAAKTEVRPPIDLNATVQEYNKFTDEQNKIKGQKFIISREIEDKLDRADLSKLTVEDFDKILKAELLGIIRGIVANESTPTVVIESILSSKAQYGEMVYFWYEDGLSQNKKIAVPTLLKFLNSSNTYLRRAAIGHKNFPISYLENLARTGNDDQRENVASGQNTPDSILSILAEDKNPTVLRAVAFNYGIYMPSASTLEKLAHRVKDPDTLHRIASDFRVNTPTLDVIAKSEDLYVLAAVVRNEKTSPTTRNALISKFPILNSPNYVELIQKYRGKSDDRIKAEDYEERLKSADPAKERVDIVKAANKKLDEAIAHFESPVVKIKNKTSLEEVVTNFMYHGWWNNFRTNASDKQKKLMKDFPETISRGGRNYVVSVAISDEFGMRVVVK